MPDKKIYIRDEALPLFEEAEKYGNSLSKVIEAALVKYVEEKRKEIDDDGCVLITVDTGRWYPAPAELKSISFKGRHLLTEKISDTDGTLPYWDTWSIFLTKKGKILVWLQTENEKENVESVDVGETESGEKVDIVNTKKTFLREASITVLEDVATLLSDSTKQRKVEVFHKNRFVSVEELQLTETIWIRRELLERAHEMALPRQVTEILDI